MYIILSKCAHWKYRLEMFTDEGEVGNALEHTTALSVGNPLGLTMEPLLFSYIVSLNAHIHSHLYVN